MNTLDNRRKAALFAVLAALSAGGSAPLIADKSINHIFIVLPLVVMAICLLAAGYYAGLARNER